MQALHRQGLAIAASIALASGGAVAASDPADLVGSHWQLIQFQSNDDHQPPLQPSGAATYTLSLLSGGRARLQLDCNQALGSWTAAPSRDRSNGTFAFGRLAQTRMLCPEPTLEPALTAKLPWVRSYRLEGSQLFLALMADGPTLWRVRQLGQPVPLRDLESETPLPRR